MSNVSMKLLRTFLVMAEKKSAAKTARCLDISRDSVRQHIRRLEEAVGKRLFEKPVLSNREEMGCMQLTQDGRVFLPKAINALRAHDRMFDDESAGKDPSMEASALAARLLEKAIAVLKCDLSDEEVEHSYRILLGGRSDGA